MTKKTRIGLVLPTALRSAPSLSLFANALLPHLTRLCARVIYVESHDTSLAADTTPVPWIFAIVALSLSLLAPFACVSHQRIYNQPRNHQCAEVYASDSRRLSRHIRRPPVRIPSTSAFGFSLFYLIIPVTRSLLSPQTCFVDLHAYWQLLALYNYESFIRVFSSPKSFCPLFFGSTSTITTI